MPQIIIPARSASIGPGLSVRRILPFRLRRMVGPFIFLDHAGPVQAMPGKPHGMDVLPHPHIGLSTVSYLFNGQVTHRDSLGVEQVIKPGEVNWMTAGSGIAHSERFEDPAALTGGLEMIQTWVALPEKDEEAAPSFTNYGAGDMLVFSDEGLWYRLIAGAAYGLTSPVKTNSPLLYMHVTLEKGSLFRLPDGYTERGIYVVKGGIEQAGALYNEGTMVVYGKNEDPLIEAREPSTVLVLGGEPLGERHIWWNFVSSRRERIEQAKEDWKQGRIKLPPLDNGEFIPLPPDHRKKEEGPAPGALS